MNKPNRTNPDMNKPGTNKPYMTKPGMADSDASIPAASNPAAFNPPAAMPTASNPPAAMPAASNPPAAMPAASGPYDDIINLPHHVSAVRPHMSTMERAAQFSPFAALTGYDAVIKETGRLTDQRIQLTEESKAELDRKLQIIASHIGAPTGALAGNSASDSASGSASEPATNSATNSASDSASGSAGDPADTKARREQAPEVSVTYFVPDSKKAGGKYVTIAGQVKKIDQNAHLLIMEDGTEIPTDDIAEIRL